jgi:hypothetical protein
VPLSKAVTDYDKQEIALAWRKVKREMREAFASGDLEVAERMFGRIERLFEDHLGIERWRLLV